MLRILNSRLSDKTKGLYIKEKFWTANESIKSSPVNTQENLIDYDKFISKKYNTKEIVDICNNILYSDHNSNVQFELFDKDNTKEISDVNEDILYSDHNSDMQFELFDKDN
ncbi:5692_t:CDS:2 [Dentiscutata erythropus]|uniref:5692_t:CDS:1 n=1 Tax=Dentiscutata erythropus TaxID=1348616 RepID=A0A9N8WKP6_9GLOM|nr:5692_t:CDS:2 [Dentiscutata erythropus]